MSSSIINTVSSSNSCSVNAMYFLYDFMSSVTRVFKFGKSNNVFSSNNPLSSLVMYSIILSGFKPFIFETDRNVFGNVFFMRSP